MSKRRINDRQAERIAAIQERRRRKATQSPDTATAELDDSTLGPEQIGLVIVHYGKRATVADANQQLVHCQLRQHLGRIVAGDRVTWRTITDNAGVIIAVHPRHNILGRPDLRGEIKTIAANIDQMFIVTAPIPTISTLLLDSYLVAAEHLGITPVIVCNKIDLNADSNVQTMQIYRDLGYKVLLISAKTRHGVDALISELQGKTSVFIGQSGVGKSSILHMLLPEQDIKTQAISALTGLGTHTTTASQLYYLPSGGHVIDSPGIRAFNLWHMRKNDILRGFRDIVPLLGQCKFRNCEHTHVHGCALQSAVATGNVAPSRLESLLKLLTDSPK